MKWFLLAPFGNFGLLTIPTDLPPEPEPLVLTCEDEFKIHVFRYSGVETYKFKHPKCEQPEDAYILQKYREE